MSLFRPMLKKTTLLGGKKCRWLVFCILFLGISVLMFGCNDFLQEGPKGAVSEGTLNDQASLEATLTGAYSVLNPAAPNNTDVTGAQVWRSGPAHWPLGSVASDMAQKGSISGDQAPMNAIQQHRWTVTNGYFDPLWSARYEGISRANAVLTGINRVEDIPEEEASRIRAEARFLRAYFYFDLKKNFDNVPLITEETEDFNQPNNIEEEIIWPQIEEDLQFAMDNLPPVMPDQARANKWAAASFLAKAFVYQEKWDQAKSLFDDIIANGVTATGVPYALEEQFAHNFNAARQGDGWSEVVFAVEMTANDGSGGATNSWNSFILNSPHAVPPWNCCGFFLPSHDLVNSFKTTDEGLPMPEDFNNSVLENDQGIASDERFTPPETNLDPRLDWTVGRRGVPFYDFGPHPGQRWIRGPHAFAGPFNEKKSLWWNRNSGVGSNTNAFAPTSGVDYAAMRFADVLLLAAEAEIKVGSMSRALDLVNRVRERAANPEGFVENSMNEAGALAVVDSESAMLSTSPSSLDWVVRTDEDATYVFLGGDPSDISNWNKYPNPAENYNVDTYTMAEFQQAPGPLRRVHFERKLELAMEGHRFYDLARWGRAETRMNEYFEFQGALTTDVDQSDQFRFSVYPIPQVQIDNSVSGGEPVLTQNPQYQ